MEVKFKPGEKVFVVREEGGEHCIYTGIIHAVCITDEAVDYNVSIEGCELVNIELENIYISLTTALEYISNIRGVELVYVGC